MITVTYGLSFSCLVDIFSAIFPFLGGRGEKLCVVEIVTLRRVADGKSSSPNLFFDRQADGECSDRGRGPPGPGGQSVLR